MLLEILEGRAPLWKPFWLLFVLGSVCLAIAFGLLQSRVFLELVMTTQTCLPNPLKMAVFKAVVGHLFAFVAWFGVWRCAFNTKVRFFGYAARGLVLFSAAYLVLRWILLIRGLATPEGQQVLEFWANWTCRP